MSPSMAALLVGWALSGHDFPLLQQDEDQRCVRLRGPEEVGEILTQLRRFSLTPAESAEVLKQIDLLAQSEYKARQRAQTALHAARPGAAVLLRRALTVDDLEQRRRIDVCLQRMPPRWSAAQAEAAVRLLRIYRPERVGNLLWDYLPFAEDEHVEREIHSALLDLQGQGLFVVEDAAITAPEQRRCADYLRSNSPVDEGPTSLALQEARTFFRLMALGDAAVLRERCQLSFCLGGDLHAKAPGEFDNLLEQIVSNYRGYSKNFSLSFECVRRGETYVAYAPEGEQRFLSQFPAGQVRAVHVRMRFNLREEETGAVLILLKPDGPCVIGLGQGGAVKKRP